MQHARLNQALEPHIRNNAYENEQTKAQGGKIDEGKSRHSFGDCCWNDKIFAQNTCNDQGIRMSGISECCIP